MRTFTLGDFFTIWGQPLSRKQAASMKAEKTMNLAKAREYPLLCTVEEE